VETIEDEARPGRPISVRNEGLIAKVRKRIQEIFISMNTFNDVFSVMNMLVSLNIIQFMLHKPGSELSLAQVFH
jgi:hypothetical protein